MVHNALRENVTVVSVLSTTRCSMVGTTKRWTAGSRMALLLALAAFSVCAAHAQIGDVNRVGNFNCSGLGAVSATAVLTWYVGGLGGTALPPNPISSPDGTDTTWICSGDTDDIHLVIQPGSADSWTLTIKLSDGTFCGD